MKKLAVRGSRHRLADLRQAADGGRRARREIQDAVRRRADARRHAAQRQRLLRDAARRHVGRQGAGDDQLHRRRRQHPVGLQGGRSADRAHLARLCRAGQARRGGRGGRPSGEDRLAGRSARHHRPQGQAARRCCARRSAARCPQARRSGGDPVHLGLGRHAEGRRAHTPQHPGQCRPGRLAHRLPFGRQGLQRPADVPFLRPDGGHRAAADRRACRSISIRRRCTTASCRS